MRVVQFLHFPPRGSGAGVYARSLATGLQSRDHDVSMVCADHWPSLRDLPGESVFFSRAGRRAGDVDFDFPVFAAHPLSTGPRFGDLSREQLADYETQFDRAIDRVLESVRPDVLHVHHGWVIGSLLERRGLPYLVTLHGTERMGFESYLAYRDRALRALHGASHVLAVEEAVAAEAISAYGLPPERVSTIRTGVNTDVFHPHCAPSRSLGASVADPNQPTLLYSGRLETFKGVDVLIDALAIMAAQGRKPRLLVAGDGRERASLEVQARSLKLDRVHFLGLLPNADLAPLLDSADLAIVPSRLDTLPLAALEALACGTPVVASRVGGLANAIIPEVGRLVEPNDSLALANAISDLLARHFKQDQSAAIAAYARAHFGFASMLDQIEVAYARTVAGARVRSVA